MGRLDGKVALISGGARGQGATEGRMMAQEGAKVVLGDILDDQGREVEAEIRAAGGAARYVHLNVTSESDWQAAVQTAESSYGALHVLVNNAGILIRAAIEETTEDDFDRIMAVNVKGVFLGTKHAIPAMRRAGGGSIVNISSVAGLVGSAGSSAYSATKGRRAPVHQVNRYRERRGQHPLQFRPPRPHHYRHDHPHARGSGVVGRADAAASSQAPRQAGRYRLWGHLSRLRRVVLCDRHRAGH